MQVPDPAHRTRGFPRPEVRPRRRIDPRGLVPQRGREAGHHDAVGPALQPLHARVARGHLRRELGDRAAPGARLRALQGRLDGQDRAGPSEQREDQPEGQARDGMHLAVHGNAQKSYCSDWTKPRPATA